MEKGRGGQRGLETGSPYLQPGRERRGQEKEVHVNGSRLSSLPDFAKGHYFLFTL